MTFIVKHRGDITRPLLCTYTCPVHGEFDAEVERDADGNAPDRIRCPLESLPCGICLRCKADEKCSETWGMCGAPATWTPTPIGCRVRRVEVVRGNWEKPERPTYLDTRKLGEGQSPEEFRAERRKVWNEERHRKVKELLR